jgi:hypothetical protein
MGWLTTPGGDDSGNIVRRATLSRSARGQEVLAGKKCSPVSFE